MQSTKACPKSPLLSYHCLWHGAQWIPLERAVVADRVPYVPYVLYVPCYDHPEEVDLRLASMNWAFDLSDDDYNTVVNGIHARQKHPNNQDRALLKRCRRWYMGEGDKLVDQWLKAKPQPRAHCAPPSLPLTARQLSKLRRARTDWSKADNSDARDEVLLRARDVLVAAWRAWEPSE